MWAMINVERSNKTWHSWHADNDVYAVLVCNINGVHSVDVINWKFMVQTQKIIPPVSLVVLRKEDSP